MHYSSPRQAPLIAALIASITTLFIASASAQQTPIASPSATPTATAKPDVKKRCCFCVVADPPARNAEDQKKYCQQCLMNKSANAAAQSCDTLETVLASRFNGPDPKTCSSDVLAYNLEHGPILQKSFERLKKCVAPMPTCNVTFMDLSCSSFGDADEVQKEVAALQALLGPNQTVTVCGNISDNHTTGCGDFISARKQLIITSTSIEDPIQPCPKASTYCMPPRLAVRCKAPDGSIQRQHCCAKVGVVDGTEQQLKYGVWGVPGKFCSGSPSCPPGCDKRASCTNDNSSSEQECIKIAGGDFTCMQHTDNCTIGGKTCNPSTGRCEVVPSPSPSASPAPSKETSASRTKNSTMKTALRSGNLEFLQLDRSGRSFGVDRALLFTLAERKNLLGSSTVESVSGAPGFSGILLGTVDPASTLGLLRFKQGDVIHFVNDVTVSNIEELSRALVNAAPLTTITFSRGSWRWIITLRVRAISESRPLSK